jgi:hypothetical protein
MLRVVIQHQPAPEQSRITHWRMVFLQFFTAAFSVDGSQFPPSAGSGARDSTTAGSAPPAPKVRAGGGGPHGSAASPRLPTATGSPCQRQRGARQDENEGADQPVTLIRVVHKDKADAAEGAQDGGSRCLGRQRRGAGDGHHEVDESLCHVFPSYPTRQSNSSAPGSSTRASAGGRREGERRMLGASLDHSPRMPRGGSPASVAELNGELNGTCAADDRPVRRHRHRHCQR